MIVAAGKGERAGTELPKQYERLAGKPMLRRTVEAFSGYQVQVVIGAGQEDLAAHALDGLALPAPVTGGATRQQSARLGLEALAKEAPDFVLIHDAARPLISRKVIGDVIAALQAGADGALPMVAASDTLRRRDAADRWLLVDRENLYRAQTPQGFVYAKILKAHRDHAAEEVTDDVALGELAGLKVEMVQGEEKNIKVTRKEDFALAEKHYRQAIESDPRYSLAYFDLGNVLDETGRVQEAILTYKTALQLAPTYADAHYNLALAYEKIREPRKALRHWQAYVKLDTGGPWSVHARSQIKRILQADGLKLVHSRPR